jgi:hypothetical protein
MFKRIAADVRYSRLFFLFVPPLLEAGIKDLGAGLGIDILDVQAEFPFRALAPAPDDFRRGGGAFFLARSRTNDLDLRSGRKLEVVQVEDEFQAAAGKIIDDGGILAAVHAVDSRDFDGNHALES